MNLFKGKPKAQAKNAPLATHNAVSAEEELLLHRDHDGYFDPEMTEDPNNKLIEILLPWGVEQRVAMWLNLIKIPMILIVCVLGSVVETKVVNATDATWTGNSMFNKGPTCYVNKMNMDKWFNVNNTAVDFLAHYVNDSAQYLKDWVNDTMHYHNSTACELVDGKWKCEIIDTAKWGYNVTIPPNMCTIHKEEGECTVGYPDREMEEQDRLAGFGTRLPFLPYTLVWAFFKLTFLPVHPIDRVVNFFEEKNPPSQPIFKLLTEPHMRASSVGGAMSKACGLVAMIVKIVRYTLLPNSLIVPLITMGSHPHCPNYFYYTFDRYLGTTIYYWVIGEVSIVIALYALGKTSYGSSCVGTKGYRCYKIIWFMTSGISFWFFIVDQVMIFNWRFWEGMDLVIRQIIWISFDFRFSIDVVQLAASINVMLDVASLFVMILSFLCPKVMGALTGGGIETKLASTSLGSKLAPAMGAMGVQVPTKSTNSTASSTSSQPPAKSKGGLAGLFGK